MSFFPRTYNGFALHPDALLGDSTSLYELNDTSPSLAAAEDGTYLYRKSSEWQKAGLTRIVLGNGTNLSATGLQTIAIGFGGAGDSHSLGTNSTGAIAIGSGAGAIVSTVTNNTNAIAIGTNAGATGQNLSSIAIGFDTGKTNQGSAGVAIGLLAANQNQGSTAVSVGSEAGRVSQGIDGVAIGNKAGQSLQGNASVAIGLNAGQTSQGVNAVAIGKGAGNASQHANSIVINATGIALNTANVNSTYLDPVRTASGDHTLLYDSTTKEVVKSPGVAAATTLYGLSDTDANLQTAEDGTYLYRNSSIWVKGGLTRVALGVGTDLLATGTSTVAIGFSNAGSAHSLGASSAGAIAIGHGAGTAISTVTDNTNAIAIGTSAGADDQASGTIAIGNQAGQISQGVNAVAIGGSAGNINQHANSIVINATGFDLNTSNSNATYVSPIRTATGDYTLLYDSTTKEIVKALGSGSVAALYELTDAANDLQTAEDGTYLYRNSSEWVKGGLTRVALGNGTDLLANGTSTVAIGFNAAGSAHSLGASSAGAIAIGSGAGATISVVTDNTNAIAIGTSAGSDEQASGAVALGYQAGQTAQGVNAVAIGKGAGNASQHANSIVINATGVALNTANASSTYLDPIRTATGDHTLLYDSTTKEIVKSPGVSAVTTLYGLSDTDANLQTAEDGTYIYRNSSIWVKGGLTRVALGAGTDLSATGTSTVAIGFSNTGSAHSLGASSVGAIAIGSGAGATVSVVTDNTNAIAIGTDAGSDEQASGAIALGVFSGQFNQETQAIAIGSGAGRNNQAIRNIAIGLNAGDFAGVSTTLSASITNADTTITVADGTGFISAQKIKIDSEFIFIGTVSGNTFSSCIRGADSSVAIAHSIGAAVVGVVSINSPPASYTGVTGKGDSIAFGTDSGRYDQNDKCISIGMNAALNYQQSKAIAIGGFSGNYYQGEKSVALGYEAGQLSQGASAIAIGYQAGQTSQHANSIVINATGIALDTTNASATYLDPVRTATGDYNLLYDSSSKELVKSLTPIGTASALYDLTDVADNLQTAEDGTYLYRSSSEWVKGGLTRVALGAGTALSATGTSTVAIGFSSTGSAHSLGASSAGAIAIGSGAGVTVSTVTDNTNAIAIGESAGNSEQAAGAVALGRRAGNSSQGTFSLAVGYEAGNSNQGGASVSLGFQAGFTSQGDNAVAMGNQAGKTTQGLNAIAIGTKAGETTQGVNAIAIGRLAGNVSQHANSIVINATGIALNTANASSTYLDPIRTATGDFNLLYDSSSKELVKSLTPIGTASALYDLTDTAADLQTAEDGTYLYRNSSEWVKGGLTRIALGNGTDLSTTGTSTIAIGFNDTGDAHSLGSASIGAIAIGINAGVSVSSVTDNSGAIAIGINAGSSEQHASSVAIGFDAGRVNQKSKSIGIGQLAANQNQGESAIAVGYQSGQSLQGDEAIAIGLNAGQLSQGVNSIALGTNAGQTSQHNNSIIINATGVALNTANASATYLDPVRTASGDYNLLYDSTTKEIVKSLASVGTTLYSLTDAADDLQTAEDGTYLYRSSSEWVKGGLTRVALGAGTDLSATGTSTVAIGFSAAGSAHSLGASSAGAIAIGSGAGASITTTVNNTNAIAIGTSAGNSDQSTGAISLGYQAGQTSQGVNAIAIGESAGAEEQAAGTVAIGYQAGQASQGVNAIAIGANAGNSDQATGSVAIGASTDIAVGSPDGIAIGNQATLSGISTGSIAIGSKSSVANHVNSIILNATNLPKTTTADSQFIVNPVRLDDTVGTYNLMYDEITGEIVKTNKINSTGLSLNDLNDVTVVNTEGTYLSYDGVEWMDGGVGRINLGMGTKESTNDQFSVAIGFDSAGEAHKFGPNSTGAIAIGYGAQKSADIVTDNQLSIAIGVEAGNNNQRSHSIALGPQAGYDDQGIASVAIGHQAGKTSQGDRAIAIGENAGITNQHANSIVINATGVALNTANASSTYLDPVRTATGDFNLLYDSSSKELVKSLTPVGATLYGLTDAADDLQTAEDGTYLYRNSSNWVKGGLTRVALGNGTDLSATGTSTVAIGFNSAGSAHSLGANSAGAIAIGSGAGSAITTVIDNINAIAIGTNTGASNQATGCVAIGVIAGQFNQALQAIAIGSGAGNTNQATRGIAIGVNANGFVGPVTTLSAGITDTDTTITVASGTDFTASQKIKIESEFITIGTVSGNTFSGCTRGVGSVAVAHSSGVTVVGIVSTNNPPVSYLGATARINSIALGTGAGRNDQTDDCIAIGNTAAFDYQQSKAIAIGGSSGNYFQGAQAVAIGYQAGQLSQGASAIALGYRAGQTSQHANSIVINATGVALNTTNASSTYLDPVRTATGDHTLLYDSTTKEVVKSPGVAGATTLYGLADTDANLQTAEDGTYLYRNSSIWVKGGLTRVALGNGTDLSATGTSTVAIGFNAAGSAHSLGASSAGAIAIGAGAGATVSVVTDNTNAIAIGTNAGSDEQASGSVALGYQAGQTSQGVNAVAIGANAGVTSQHANSIVINATGVALNTANASSTYLDPIRTATGDYNLLYDSTTKEVVKALGVPAATTLYDLTDVADNLQTAEDGTYLYRNSSNWVKGGLTRVALGSGTNLLATGTSTVAIGFSNAGAAHSLGTNSSGAIAIGFAAGSAVTTMANNSNAIAIGTSAGSSNQANGSVALGPFTGQFNQATQAVAIGNGAGKTNQATRCVAIGFNTGGSVGPITTLSAGITNTDTTITVASGTDFTAAQKIKIESEFITIGTVSGNTFSSCVRGQDGSTAVAHSSGVTVVGLVSTLPPISYLGATSRNNSVAIGSNAGRNDQTDDCIAIGNTAGFDYQQSKAIALGNSSGNYFQGAQAIAIGYQAGQTSQGASSIALGYRAGQTSQHANSIVINATGVAVNTTNASSTYLDPVRTASGDYSLLYNSSTKEIVKSLGVPNVTNLYDLTDVANDLQTAEDGTYLYRNSSIWVKGGLTRVALGAGTDLLATGTSTVAIGFNAAGSAHSLGASSAGAIAIGSGAGATVSVVTDNTNAIAIGTSAGASEQASGAIALGHQAGQTSQGINAVAIGANAGVTSQHDNSIVINATGVALNTANAGSTYLDPVRTSTGDFNLLYDSVSKELVKSLTPVGTTLYGLTDVADDLQTAEDGTYLYRNSSEWVKGGLTRVALGNGTDLSATGTSTVAIGFNAAGSAHSLGASSAGAIAIGSGAGATVSVVTDNTNAIAIGTSAGNSEQASGAIALGHQAGQTSQGVNAVAIGKGAGNTSQHANSIVINATGVALNTANASSTYLDPIRTATGDFNLLYNSTSKELIKSLTPVGTTLYGLTDAADNLQTAEDGTYLYRSLSNWVKGGLTRIALGAGTNLLATGTNTVAIGFSNAGSAHSFGASSSGAIAIGLRAGVSASTISNNINSIAIGTDSGNSNQENGCIAIGPFTGQFNQATQAIAIGSGAGRNNQATRGIAIGINTSNSVGPITTLSADITNADTTITVANGTNFVAAQKIKIESEFITIGSVSGNTFSGCTRGVGSVAVAHLNGVTVVGIVSTNNPPVSYLGATSRSNSIAIGSAAGRNDQTDDCVSIGNSAGFDYQQSKAIAIGGSSGIYYQGAQSVAIGYQAGQSSQGASSIALGYRAGQTSQHANSIVINATGVAVNTLNASATYLDPVRTASGDHTLLYDSVTKEIVKSPGVSGATTLYGLSDVADDLQTAEDGTYLYRNSSEWVKGGLTRVALGAGTDLLATGTSTVAIGFSDAGSAHSLGSNSAGAIAIGSGAGVAVSSVTNNVGAIAIGTNAGNSDQAEGTIAIGTNAGNVDQEFQSIAIGVGAGQNNQATRCIAMGVNSNAFIGPITTLSSGITNTDAAILVTNGTNFSSGQKIVIENEFITIGTATGNSFTGCARGVDSSTAVSHSNGATVVGIVSGNNPPAGYLGASIRGDSIAFGTDSGRNDQKDGCISIGVGTAVDYQQSKAIAIGGFSGNYYQGENCVAVGHRAGQISQGAESVAIGNLAGQTNQHANSIVINATSAALDTSSANSTYINPIRTATGDFNLLYDSVSKELVKSLTPVGGNTTLYGLSDAADNLQTAEDGTYLYRNSSEWVKGGLTRVALGNGTDLLANGTSTVAIGFLNAGAAHSLGTNSAGAIAIGSGAGVSISSVTNNVGAIAIGTDAGNSNQAEGAIAVGFLAGNSDQEFQAIAIGNGAGRNNQATRCIAVGINSSGFVGPITTLSAGITNTSTVITVTNGAKFSSGQKIVIENEFITIGTATGNSFTGCARGVDSSTAVSHPNGATVVGIVSGNNPPAGYLGASIRGDSIAFGTDSGRNDQKDGCISIGVGAAVDYQQSKAIAIGGFSGNYYQGSKSVAIGYQAGQISQGASAIAIGEGAGNFNQHANSIVINATGVFLDTSSASSTYINPIRTATGDFNLLYNSTTKEVVKSSTPSGGTLYGLSDVADNLQTAEDGTYLYRSSSEWVKGGLTRVALGAGTNLSANGTNTVAIGFLNAGSAHSLGANSAGAIAIGFGAGSILSTVTNNINAIAIGADAGFSGQNTSSIAIGAGTGRTNQSFDSVAIGREAAFQNQNAASVAIGLQSGYSGQDTNSVAIGNSSGKTNQGSNAVALGVQAGETSQGTNAIAIGNKAALSNQHANSIVINATGVALNTANASSTYLDPVRTATGDFNLLYDSTSKELVKSLTPVGVTLYRLSDVADNLQTAEDGTYLYRNSSEWVKGGLTRVALGNGTNLAANGTRTVAIGFLNAGSAHSLGANSAGAIAIGSGAGSTLSTVTNNINAIAIGADAGNSGQDTHAVAIGASSGRTNQKFDAVAIGKEAAFENQNAASVAIGTRAGYSGQDTNSVAIGNSSGKTNQGSNAVAIGVQAGETSQGTNAIAIGNKAAFINQHANSIVINATGNTLNTTNVSSTYLDPVRTATGDFNLLYNSTSKELVKSLTPVGMTLYGLSDVADNLQTAEDGTYLYRSSSNWVKGGLTRVALGAGTNLAANGTNTVAIGFSSTGSAHSLGINSAGAIAIGSGAGTAVSTVTNNTNAIAIGTSAGSSGQASGAIALGHQAGQSSQGVNSIAIGDKAAFTNQHANSIVINATGIALNTANASATYLNPVRTATGDFNLLYNSTSKELVKSLTPVGTTLYGLTDAADNLQTAEDGTYLYRSSSNWVKGGLTRVALGNGTNLAANGTSTVAIGFSSTGSAHSLGANSAGAIAIGFSAGSTVSTVTNNVNAIAIGTGAGENNQNTSSIAIGVQAGKDNQGFSSIAIGAFAGVSGQNNNAVAIGIQAGGDNQGVSSVAIGPGAGFSGQNNNAVAIGNQAGGDNQGVSSVAIGAFAGYSNQHANSIVINATENILNTANASATYIDPIRTSSTGDHTLHYNSTTKEVIKSPGVTGATTLYGLSDTAANLQTAEDGTYLYRSSGIWVKSGLTRIVLGNGTNIAANGTSTIAIGFSNAGSAHSLGANSTGAIAIGSGAGAVVSSVTNNSNAIAIGVNAGNSGQSSGTVAIGFQAGRLSQGTNAIAIGSNAADSGQHANSIVINATGVNLNTANLSATYINPIRTSTGDFNLLYNSTSKEVVKSLTPVGGVTTLYGLSDVADDLQTAENGTYLYRNSSEWVKGGLTRIAIGNGTNLSTNGQKTVAIGFNNAGSAHSLGVSSESSIAIGDGAGATVSTITNNSKSIAIGYNAGNNNQDASAVAIGNSAGQAGQGFQSIAIGKNAGFLSQGPNAVAIGVGAGSISQHANSIILCAGDVAINSTVANSTYINPIRTSATGDYILKYDSATFEVVKVLGTSNPTTSYELTDVADNIQTAEDGTYLYRSGSNWVKAGVSRIAFGSGTNLFSSGTSTVAIGFSNTGNAHSLGSFSSGAIAIGSGAGASTSIADNRNSIAIGTNAGNVNQGSFTVSMGNDAGLNSQGSKAIAIGYQAGRLTQGVSAIAIGANAGDSSQHANSIVINATGTALNTTIASATYINPIRTSTGDFNLLYNSTSKEVVKSLTPVGGVTTLYGLSDVEDNLQTAENGTYLYRGGSTWAKGGSTRVALGSGATLSNRGANTIAIGFNGVGDAHLPGGESDNSIAIGTNAGAVIDEPFVPHTNAIAIGTNAGNLTQYFSSIAIGLDAGRDVQHQRCIAIGEGAGKTNQQLDSIAIGSSAGLSSQNNWSIAIGKEAGYLNQSAQSIAIGTFAGQSNQGNNSIAIGNQAGASNQHSQSIIINAFTGELNSTSSNALFIKPIRQGTGAGGGLTNFKPPSGFNLLAYDPISGEIIHYPVV